MKPIQALRDLVRDLVSRAPGRGSAPADEFDDLLTSLGASPAPPGESSELALKDATIEELRVSLECLQPLGEELAACERGRLALESEVTELRARLATASEASAPDSPPAPQEPSLEKLEGALEKERRKCARLEERLAKKNEKYEERRRVAAERWHELRRLRGERKRLRAELDAARELLDQVQAALPAEGSGDGPARESVERLSDLMRVESPEAPGATRRRSDLGSSVAGP